jgi:hypothetical protein
MSDKVLMPVVPEITAAMKAEHIGEFSIEFPLDCPDCDLDEPDEACEICKGQGFYLRSINVPWTTCKEIFNAMYATAAKTAQCQVFSTKN